ncbi:MAG TPA: serine/threonine-protein kinase [Vicinamibacterales bacterium]|nr:serine/threonine-protein kinase [Vicinamibacterales bacterium]
MGHGGMASVFKATDLQTGELVALKIPFAQLERDSVFRERFQRESEIGRILNHPGIIRIVRVDSPGRLYLAMEYVEGQTLWDRMRHERPLPVDEAVGIARQLCDALEHMERHQIFHRDLKPSNVMLCRDGSVRIMDFGVAMTATARRLTLAGAKGIGTPEYMAPEQVNGRRGDHRADIYSVAAILYEMTTGQRPYDEQPDMYSLIKARLVGDPIAPRVLNPLLSPVVEEIILHGLERDPDDRYRSAADLKTDLECPNRVAFTGRAGRLKPVKVRSQAWIVAGLVAAALVAPVLLFFLFLRLLRH